MNLFLPHELELLFANSKEDDLLLDHKPVVKLHMPCTNMSWLITEILPENKDVAFGLRDSGMGCPSLGYFSLYELAALIGPAGLKVERDRSFTGAFPISVYAKAAEIVGHITEDRETLADAAQPSLFEI